MDYSGVENETRSNAEQSETGDDFRVSYESVNRRDDLYFVRAGDALKIGRTINIVNRLGKMQADSHEEVDCLLLLRGLGYQEATWHRAFADERIRGEWFTWSPEVEKAFQCLRAGGCWWEHLFPPFDMIAEATVAHLDDPDEFEDAYWSCVEDWREEIGAEIERLSND